MERRRWRRARTPRRSCGRPAPLSSPRRRTVAGRFDSAPTTTQAEPEQWQQCPRPVVPTTAGVAAASAIAAAVVAAVLAGHRGDAVGAGIVAGVRILAAA